MTTPLDDPRPSPDRPRSEDDLGAARGILIASLCGGLAWGVIVLASWLFLFYTIGSD